MSAHVNDLVRQLRRTALAQEGGLSDGQLLARFLDQRDQAALAVLIERHGSMIWGVCRRLLPSHHDAEDAFQAACLVLVRKAASIRPRELVGNWLYGVAYQTAKNARAMLAKRRAHEKQVSAMPQPEMRRRDAWHDVQGLLDQELSHLPDNYRVAIVLCDLEGRSRKETGRQLGVPEGTLAGRLRRGRALLARRLARHGIMLSTAALAASLAHGAATASLPASVLAAALRTVAPSVSNGAASGAVSATVLGVADSVTRAMLAKLLLKTTALVAVLALLALGYCGLASQQPGDVPLAQLPAQVDAAPTRQPRSVDRHGDPLPAGALARLGTVRFRHGYGITGAALSADGKTVFTSDHHSVHVWDAVTGKSKAQFFQDNYYHRGMALSPDGRTLAVVPGDLTVQLCDPNTGRPRGALPSHESGLGWLVFSADSSLLATWGGHDKSVRVWDVATQRLLHTVNFGAHVGNLSFAPDGKVIACGTEGGECQFWDLKQKRVIRTLKAAKVGVYSLYPLYSPARDRMAVWGYEDRSIRLFDVDGVKEIRRFESDDPTRKSNSPWGWASSIFVRFSRDGKTLAVFRDPGRIELLEVATGKRLRTLSCDPAHWPTFMDFSADGTRLASAGGNSWEGDHTVRLWDLASGRELLRLDGHGAPISSIAIAPDGKSIATAAEDGLIHVWERTSGRHLHHLEAHRGELQVAFSNDGQRLASWGTWRGDRTLRVWDARSCQALRQIKLPTAKDYWTGISGDGKAAVSRDLNVGAALFHNLATGKIERRLAVLGDSWPILFSAADDYVVCHDGSLWKCADNKPLVQFGRFGWPRPSVHFSADGRTLMAAVVAPLPGGFDFRGDPPADEIVIVDVVAARELRRFGRVAHKHPTVDAAALSPDGKMVISAGSGGAEGRQVIVLWETETGQERGGFVGHVGRTNAIAIGADGRFFVTGSGDTTGLIWDATRPQTHTSPVRPASTTVDPARCYADLAGDNAEQAYASMWALVNAPTKTIAFLGKQASLYTQTDAPSIQRWIKRLDSEKFVEREEAYDKLRSILDEAEPQLTRALVGNGTTLEARRRIERLRQERKVVVHKLRVIEVLERVASADCYADADSGGARRDAVALLKRIAAGTTPTRMTQEAAAALRRLGHLTPGER
jgi:RNA polymerase sigma factor (sigma-70 family)